MTAEGIQYLGRWNDGTISANLELIREMSVDGFILASHAATLTPATPIGILFGRISGAWISESAFRRMISIALVATSISLLVDSFMGLLADV